MIKYYAICNLNFLMGAKIYLSAMSSLHVYCLNTNFVKLQRPAGSVFLLEASSAKAGRICCFFWYQ